MVTSGNFARRGVVAGFALQRPGSGLAPAIARGVLFASGTMYRPGSDPTLANAPDDSLSYLGYANGSGFYWTANPAGNAAADAVVGWVLTAAGEVVAVSSQLVAVAGSTSTGSGTSGGGAVVPGSSTAGGVGTLGGIEPMTASAGHIKPILSAKFTHEHTLAGNVTLDAPHAPTPEMIFCVRLVQDSTGGRVVTFDAFYLGMSGFAHDTTGATYASLFFQVNLAGDGAVLLQVAMNGNPIA